MSEFVPLLLRTDPTEISFAAAALRGHGIEVLTFDLNTFALEPLANGTVGPRILVPEDQLEAAKAVLRGEFAIEAEIDPE